MSSHRVRILAVELEPAPYKVDLWNAFVQSGEFDIKAIHTVAKNWAQDAGHDYQDLPVAKYPSMVIGGKSATDKIAGIWRFVRTLREWRPDYVFVAGYANVVPLASLLICVAARQNYFLHSDIFNGERPRASFAIAKGAARDLLRWVVFRTASGVLVCGRLGRDSALAAGCPEPSIVDFPYVIDVNRMLNDTPAEVPSECLRDLENGALKILFSGRMIERKGLATMLRAVTQLTDLAGFVVWIEGAGPLLDQYEQEARNLGVATRCRFLGFCQMPLHSWLIRNADIVVVPSDQDAWGIVVDEGMQLGKAVICSDGVGSGVDRIRDGVNGLLFTRADADALSLRLRALICDHEYRHQIGHEAAKSRDSYGPRHNLEGIRRLILSGTGGFSERTH